VRFVFSCRSLLALLGFAAMSTVLAQPATAGMEEAVKAMQANDLPTAEKELAVLIKERDPRAQFLAGFYISGNPESKLAEHWNAPVAPQSVDQIVRELKPDEIEKAKAEALAYTFKTK